MTSSTLEALELHPIRIPMRHRFRRVEFRDAVLIKGPSGWGEFSPFPDYPPAVTTRWLAAALELACGSLPDPGRHEITVNVTIPAVDPATAASLVRESGATTAKVKIGEPDIAAEEERVSAVRDALGESGRLRVDVNAAWDVDTATERLTRLAVYDLEYVEQPVATVEEMRLLRERVPVPLAADELVRQSSRPFEVISAGAADVLILKVQPMGGVARVLELAGKSPVPVVISSALETSVGMYAGLLAASLVDNLDYACGLGTVSLLDGDPTRAPLLAKSGVLEVRRPEPEPELLERWRPERPIEAELLRRVRAAAEMLT